MKALIIPHGCLDIKTSNGLCFDVMRTTLTLDADVAAELRQFQGSQKTTFKKAVNELLRAGIRAIKTKPQKKERFVTKTYDVGELLVPNLDNIHELLDELDAQDWNDRHRR